MLSGFSSLNQHASTFWSVTLQPLGADQATIPHMKGDCHSFNMRCSSMICSKRLQSDRPHNLLNVFPLVPSEERDESKVGKDASRFGVGAEIFLFVE